MSALSKELDRYLTVRRSLGYDLRTAEQILRKFTVFAEHEGADIVNTDLFLRWQKAFGRAGQKTWAKRLSIVRVFAQWLHSLDPKHEIPPRSLIPRREHRPRPYIYSEEEIRRILEAAADLPSINGIRALTYSTFFGLIAVTGLRVGEAVSLDVADVDLQAGVLTLRRGKFAKPRLLPISDSTNLRLLAYAKERDRLLGAPPRPFFVADHGERVTVFAAQNNFSSICRIIGLRQPQKFCRRGRGPRIHDLRHTFAVRTLINWYRTGKDPSREILKLTTYLGHANPASTYWYIHAVPELLDLASRRAEGKVLS